MFFIIKAAFWLAIVIAFIPVDQSQLQADQRNITPTQTIGLAQSLVQDMGRFCERNESACETGGELLSQMGVKARAGAEMVYTFLDDNYGKDAVAAKPAAERNAADMVETGSVTAE